MRTVQSIGMAMVLLVMLSVHAFALPTIEIRPSGSVTAESGDALDFGIYLIGDAENDISMGFYSYSLWLDPTELAFSGFTYEEPVNWLTDTAWELRTDANTGYESWWGSFAANDATFARYYLTAGSELLIGTLHTTVLDAIQDGEWDVVLNYWAPAGDAFYFGENWDPYFLAQTIGLDVAPAAIPSPVPEASSLLLLGMGLIGLGVISRKKINARRQDHPDSAFWNPPKQQGGCSKAGIWA